MCGKEDTRIENDIGLGLFRGQDDLMTQKEKDLALQQGLCATLPSRYYITTDNTVKMFNPAVQLFNPTEQTVNEKMIQENKNLH